MDALRPARVGALAGLRPETAAALLDRVDAGGEMADLWQVPTHSRNARLHLSPTGDLVETDLSSRLRLLSAEGRVTGEVDLGAGVNGPSPAFREDGSFVVVRTGALRSYSGSGQEQWDVPVEFSLKAGAAVGPEGNAYVFGEDRLHALDPQGRKLWSRPAPAGGLQARPLIGADGTVHAALQDGAVVAFTPEGEEKWRRPGLEVRTALAAGAEGTLVFAGWDGKLHCLSAEGQPLWTRDLGGDPRDYQTPEVDGQGNIYMRGAGHEALCLGPDGAERWRKPSVDHLSASPEGGVALFERGHGLELLDADGVQVAHYEEDGWLSRPQFGPDGVLYTTGESQDRALVPLDRLLQSLAQPEDPAGTIAREGDVVRVGGIDLPVRG